MRRIHTDEITRNIKEMCIEANLILTKDMDESIRKSVEKEKNPLGKQIL